MAKYKATCNFLIESTDQNFDEGTVYELTTAEAEEINQKTSLACGDLVSANPTLLQTLGIAIRLQIPLNHGESKIAILAKSL